MWKRGKNCNSRIEFLLKSTGIHSRELIKGKIYVDIFHRLVCTTNKSKTKKSHLITLCHTSVPLYHCHSQKETIFLTVFFCLDGKLIE